MAQFTPSPASLSLPTDRPFRLIIDVTPVRETAMFVLPGGKEIARIAVGMKRIDLAVTVEEAKEVTND